MDCKKCGAQASPGLSQCTYCGAAFEVDPPSATIDRRQTAQDQIQPLIRKFLRGYQGHRSENVWTEGNIEERNIADHSKKYLRLEPDEIPMIMLNKNALTIPFTGLTITNKRIHFLVLKKSFFASVVPLKKPPCSFAWSQLRSAEIAGHDLCFGTAYVGHELKLNNQVQGYLRMGTNILLDETAITYLNSFFDFLADEGVLQEHVRAYPFQ